MPSWVSADAAAASWEVTISTWPSVVSSLLVCPTCRAARRTDTRRRDATSTCAWRVNRSRDARCARSRRPWSCRSWPSSWYIRVSRWTSMMGLPSLSPSTLTVEPDARVTNGRPSDTRVRVQPREQRTAARPTERPRCAESCRKPLRPHGNPEEHGGSGTDSAETVHGSHGRTATPVPRSAGSPAAGGDARPGSAGPWHRRAGGRPRRGRPDRGPRARATTPRTWPAPSPRRARPSHQRISTRSG